MYFFHPDLGAFTYFTQSLKNIHIQYTLAITPVEEYLMRVFLDVKLRHYSHRTAYTPVTLNPDERDVFCIFRCDCANHTVTWILVMNNKPDFLCVGAQKCGTSWLQMQFEQHPEFWVPPSKEIHYFDRMHRERPLKRSHFIMRRTLEKRKRRLEITSSRVDKSRISGKIHWLESAINSNKSGIEWYESLFPESRPNLVRGDITPAYGIISKKDFEFIYKRYPDVKIIFLMRNPAGRFWASTKRRVLKKAKRPELLEDQEYLRNLAEHPRRDMRSRYDYTIRILDEVFPKENVLYGFYEEIFPSDQARDTFLLKVCAFLGAREDVELFPNRHRRYQASARVEITRDFEDYLNTRYSDVRSFIKARFGYLPAGF